MWMVNAWQDARYGVRLMTRAPGFAAVAIVTVALGIGATTAMFSVVYSVVLQPLPYREPDRLVDVWNTAPQRGMPRFGAGIANLYDVKARNRVFEDIAALRPIANFNLVGAGTPERLNGARVSPNLFTVLGVGPLIGRTFDAGEDQEGRERVAILSYGLWRRRFGGDPAIVGRTISLSGEPHTVIGVMRRDFAYPSRDYDVYAPLVVNPQDLVDRLNYNFFALARLKPGVTLEQARDELSRLAAQMAREHPKENDGIGADAAPMLADTVQGVRTPLYVLLAAVGTLLLIGCANLANLLLARALVRQRELAVRAALGASRGRLMLQAVAELTPILIAGGVCGVLGAAWAVAASLPMWPADLPRAENVGLHGPVLAAAAAALGVIAIVAGVWPALEASRGGLPASVAGLSRGATGAPRHARLRDALVVVQIAATLWLVVGAALLGRSLAALKGVNPGFNPQGVYSLHLAIPRVKYPRDRDVASVAERILAQVRALPATQSAAMINRLPLAGGTQAAPLAFDGVDPRVANLPMVDVRSATPDYFQTLQIPLLRGRAFTDADDAGAPGVAIIDERLVTTVFGAADPIGRRVRVPYGNPPWLTIVGVVGHIHHDTLEDDARPQIYFAFRQRTQDRMALAVRTRADPSAAAGAIVAAVRAVDAEQPVYDARPLEDVVDRSLGQQWLQTSLLGAFASVALLLASVGIYGVIAYAVGQRRREFGIRMALGARRAEIVRLVLGRGTALFAAGAIIGVAAAAATARVLASLLFHVAPFDLASFGVATLVLFVVALAASGLPARRAASVDPSIALRAE